MMHAAQWMAVVVAMTAGGCGGSDDAADVPTTVELYGTWRNVSAGTERTFTFAASSDEVAELAGQSPVYDVAIGPDGEVLTTVQAGTYIVMVTTLNENGGQVQDDALVTTVLYDPSGQSTGQTFGNGIQAFDGTSFVLRGTADGNRTYTLVP